MVPGSSRAMNEAKHTTTELMRWLMESYGFDQRGASLCLAKGWYGSRTLWIRVHNCGEMQTILDNCIGAPTRASANPQALRRALL
jgi:hypothetical protein